MLTSFLIGSWFMLLSATAETPIDYFDMLRRNRSLSTSVANSSLNNLFSVTDSEGEVYRLASFTALLPFTDSSGFREGNRNDAGAALLAIYHFNNFGLSPFLDAEELSQCNIKVTLELLDSQNSPINATRVFTRVLQRNHSLESPLPAGVIGAYRSAVTSPIAILTGVNDIPQVSYASTANDFDVKEQYPIFGRTIMGSIGEAQVPVEYFSKILKATHVGILFVTDSFGSSLQKAFQDAATQVGIITDSVAFSYAADFNGLEIPNAVASLKSKQFNLFYVIAFESHYEAIMQAAYDQGLVGDGKLWIFDGFDLPTFRSKLKFKADSSLAKGSAGIGLIEVSGGIRPEIIYPHNDDVPPVQKNPTSSFQRFRTAWRDAMMNKDFLKYANGKVDASLSSIAGYDPNWNFSQEPTSHGSLAYDAVTGLALSYCRALAQYNHTDNFTGSSAFEFFRNLDQDGASGRLKIDPVTGTRDYNTLTFQVLNIRPSKASDSNTTLFDIVPTNSYTDGIWSTIENRSFVYAGGGTTVPQSLPDAVVNENYIGPTGLAVGYTLMGIVMFACLMALGWLLWFSSERIVRSSQPLFLFMICMGTFVMASSIIPLSFDETVTGLAGLDAACMAAPWLYLSGAILAFSALMAKTRGVHQAFTNPELDFIHMTSLDFFVSFTILFGLNLAVMIPWTLIAPLEWNRVPASSTDIFDRPIESYGICSNGDSLPFVIAILIFNISALLVANWWAYQARNIETEYHESRYIAISMASVLQAWCMGIPILIVVWENPQAKFFVEAGIIFITALAVLLLIFIPKMLSIRADRLKVSEDSKRQAYNLFQARSRQATFAYVNNASNSALPMDKSHTDTLTHGVISENSTPSGDDVATATTSAAVAVIPKGECKDSEDLGDEINSEESPNAKESTGRRSIRSSLFSGVAEIRKSMKLKKCPPTIDESGEHDFGLKVIYNPRSNRSLKAYGADERSRIKKLNDIDDIQNEEIGDEQDVINIVDGDYMSIERENVVDEEDAAIGSSKSQSIPINENSEESP